MIFFGTGAAELHPNPFCNCPVCAGMRARGDIFRKRSCFYVNRRTMIDFGPEALAASQQYDTPLYDLEQIFFTHTHEDHLCIDNLNVLTMTPWRKGRTLNLYISEKGLAWVRAKLEALEGLHCQAEGMKRLEAEGYIRWIPVTPYSSFTAGEWKVKAVESIHQAYGRDERALNYLLEAGDGKKLLYVADSGLYGEDQLSYLANAKADTLVMEGTWGNVEINMENGHLNGAHFVENLRRMLQAGLIREDTGVYMTHINPVGTWTPAEYQAFLDQNAPIPAIVAHDGLKLPW